eukprot:TRINITY_DN1028_c0_g1_i1.p1 TRINITY_DN1028_c0_g1~~TRINITY_DN1028_c0_g1_i1.p1  ORF type:complete len:508 (+),score=64.60 TRINITY_DN1028_c0_g1_i1:108-1526(+)
MVASLVWVPPSIMGPTTLHPHSSGIALVSVSSYVVVPSPTRAIVGFRTYGASASVHARLLEPRQLINFHPFQPPMSVPASSKSVQMAFRNSESPAPSICARQFAGESFRIGGNANTQGGARVPLQAAGIPWNRSGKPFTRFNSSSLASHASQLSDTSISTSCSSNDHHCHVSQASRVSMTTTSSWEGDRNYVSEPSQSSLTKATEEIKFRTEQESEILERLPKGECANRLEGFGTDHVRLVSLGCMCSPKLSFQRLGRGAETLPFDWMRTSLEGILHFMRSDFDGFFDYATVKPGCGNMTMYRSQFHSFWHDNPDDPNMREKYARRIDRFKKIDASSQPVLFVRAVASTDELADAEEFVQELHGRFGELAYLLLIIDFQYKQQGLALVNSVRGNLLLYHHRAEDREPAVAPYMKPIEEALLWVVGANSSVTQFVDMREAIDHTDKTDWGLNASGGEPSFEENPSRTRLPCET